MRNIDLIRQVISASENNWPHVLGCLNINVPDSPRRHAPCPACGGKDRFRFDDNGRGSFICNQCGAGDGLDLIKRVNNCDTTEAALLAADVLGIDYRTTETPEATSQKREQLETERQRREQERLKRAEKDEQQRRDTFSRQFDDMRRKAVNGKSDYLVAKGVGDFTFPVLPDGSLLLALVDKSGAVTAAQLPHHRPNGSDRQPPPANYPPPRKSIHIRFPSDVPILLYYRKPYRLCRHIHNGRPNRHVSQ